MKLSACSKTYAGRRVLALPELELPDGGICAVIGANGSGKSTFAKILAGVLPSDENNPVCPPDVTVGYMPQQSYAFRMSTRANILLTGGSPDRAEMLIRALQLERLSASRANRLSGGETARMALARLLMREYGLLVLDEPTASMDMASTCRAEQLLTQYNQEFHGTIVLVTHSLQQARRIAAHVLFFHQGTLAEQGPAETVLNRPTDARTQQFLEFYGA